jgi:hypothetical protein
MYTEGPTPDRQRDPLGYVQQKIPKLSPKPEHFLSVCGPTRHSPLILKPVPKYKGHPSSRVVQQGSCQAPRVVFDHQSILAGK